MTWSQVVWNVVLLTFAGALIYSEHYGWAWIPFFFIAYESEK